MVATFAAMTVSSGSRSPPRPGASSTSSTSSSAKAETACSKTSRTSGATVPCGGVQVWATRSRLGGRAPGARKGVVLAGSPYGPPTDGPAITSSIRAVSATVRAIGPLLT